MIRKGFGKMPAILAAFVLALVLGACGGSGTATDPGPALIPAPWYGTFTGGNDSLTLNANGSASWNIQGQSGSGSGFSVATGGTLYNNNTAVGSWVYLVSGGLNVGIIAEYPYTSPYGSMAIAIRQDRVNSTVSQIQSQLNMVPVPGHISVLGNHYFFGGNR